MKTLDLQAAQRVINDPQAIRRGYLSKEILADAVTLAQSVVQMPDFGKVGYLAAVGCPENYWVANCPSYADLSAKYKTRQHSALIQLAEEMVAQDRREAVEARWASLEIIRKKFQLSQEERDEYLTLSGYLGYPAKA